MFNTVPIIEWQKTFGGSDDDFLLDIHQFPNGEFVVSGYSESNDGDVSGYHGEVDNWIAILDENGSLKWQNSFGGSN